MAREARTPGALVIALVLAGAVGFVLGVAVAAIVVMLVAEPNACPQCGRPRSTLCFECLRGGTR